MVLDVPDEVRQKVVADGDAAWLVELPSTVESLARDWSLTIGASLRGGHAALVVEATTADGTALYDLVPDPATRHDMLCDVAARLWQPIGANIDLPTGADEASRYADLLPRLWEETGRACAQETVRDALACAESRRRAHNDRRAVLVHGDVHDFNALQVADGTFKLVDPKGLRAEPACDLGTIVRCNPGHDDVRRRTQRLAARSGVEASAIWEWGTIHRVVSGLYSRSIGFQPFGDMLLAEADRLNGGSD